MLNITSIIDHTLLKPEATKEMIEKLCSEAKEYNFFSVCVNPYYVKTAKEELEGSNVKIATVIGFPLGSTPKEVKAFEASEAIKNGADELDMVINIGALKDGDYTTVEEDIKAVVNEATDKALVKVIIETCLLDDEEKKKACEIARAAGADFVKTSTGFSTGGATVEDVKLMREVVGEDLGVKASGGIRDYETAKKMVEAGASRIGASSSIEIAKAMNK
ncbi:deoxyribose-phosphate aldolase [Anaerosalibacter bizertensis]|uniref:Deoxyribose-phosphate aldolase n=1 Tax=Anaerosalibacter bizertensis TaxID=932217 RepID=A0A844FGZ8_9FIRM|nr:deoxyribose-phosphate aldolase [Anaerosalibacter bizertensis]MBU5294220.1 deoxyribose-phosphate aldolase [Anaerosalibacter bizertensis]MSS43269.1 deoxyribose-phosphate aldolase [Anaerosalibacter bizertensis]